MVRAATFFILAGFAASAAVAGGSTNWGIRTAPGAGGGPIIIPPKTPYVDPSLAPFGGGGRASVNMSGIAAIGAQWGRVTSTHRSPAHNRRVGGVPNSYHLSGRAIDIARRAGVSHWQIAAALRNAGYNLVESLDEGDHSHFAFGQPGETKRRDRRDRARIVTAEAGGKTHFRIVYAPAGGSE